MFRQVTVFLYGRAIGHLRQDEDGFHFSYLTDYDGIPLSLSFPVQQQHFHAKKLFPYFLSLAPEGWLKQKFAQFQRLDEQDLFGLLLNNGKNLIGAVQLVAEA